MQNTVDVGDGIQHTILYNICYFEAPFSQLIVFFVFSKIFCTEVSIEPLNTNSWKKTLLCIV